MSAISVVLPAHAPMTVICAEKAATVIQRNGCSSATKLDCFFLFKYNRRPENQEMLCVYNKLNPKWQFGWDPFVVWSCLEGVSRTDHVFACSHSPQLDEDSLGTRKIHS